MLVLAALVWADGQLPERVASHFGGGGVADGWQSRQGFLVTFGVIALVTALIFGTIGLWIPRIPLALVNLPNREYWLAPQRRRATMRELTAQLVGFGAATNVFLLAMLVLTVQANVDASGVPTLSRAFWVFFAVYMVGVVAWVVWMLVRYSRRPDRQA